jgi:phosphotransferase system HPr (HPr) family protein
MSYSRRVSNAAEATIEITNKRGIHVHPSEEIAKIALHFLSKISIISGHDIANARSVISLTGLGAGFGARIRIHAEGPDADAAVHAIAALFATKFGEE